MVEKTFALVRFGRTSSKIGIWYFGLKIALFKSRGSRHILIFPGFATTTTLLIHSVGSVTFCMMPFFSNSSIFSFTSFFSVTAIRLGACCTGVCFRSTTKVLESPICPRPSKTSLYSLKMFSFVSGLRGFAVSETTLLTGISSPIVTFINPSVSQVSADNNGLLVLSTIWNFSSSVVPFLCTFTLAMPRGFITDPSNNLSLTLLFFNRGLLV